MSYSRAQPSYRDLRGVVAEGTAPIAVWIGAGLSMDAGLPTWAGLRGELLEAGRAKADGFDGDERDRVRTELAAAERGRDYWVGFERIKDVIGRATFETTVKRTLSGSSTSTVPLAYERVWRLGAHAVLTLNLDDFARRGHAAAHSGSRSLLSLDGRAASRMDGYTLQTTDWVANLHGSLEDASSWVLTRSDLQGLMRFASYPEFLRRVLHGFTNIFVGISADDIAVGGHLDKLRQTGVELGRNYWFSNRQDPDVDAWAESAGLQMIRYQPVPDHSAVLLEFLDDLIDARPEPESSPAPVRPSFVDTQLPALSDQDLPAPAELAVWPSAEEMRIMLNREAGRILEKAEVGGATDYEAFCQRYGEAIYRAWYISTETGSNLLMGYRLEEEVATGAFGRVFRAVDAQGSQVAVKLLRHEIRSKSDLLSSFRRGVRSMEILSERGVQSMVRYRGAAEIPSMVVMDWIEGPNLAQAREANVFDDWDILLKVCGDLTQVVLNAHNVPERVLHRDLRPANIMLRDYWNDISEFEVVVLDFDLSWHQGAESRSVQYSTALGYLAPEQRGVVDRSTRHAGVDVYGLGMTFWYLLTGTDPVPDQHMHLDFDDRVHVAASRFASSEWLSLGRRFADLVCWMTRNLQEEPPDLRRVIGEITALRSAVARIDSAVPLALRVDELAARTEYFRDYRVSDDGLGFSAVERRGIVARLAAVPAEGAIRLEVSWARTGTEQRSGLNKYVDRADETIRARLSSSGWAVTGNRKSGQSLHIVAQRASLPAAAIDEVATRLDSALGSIQFN